MFSCCRANSKNVKTSKKDKHKKSTEHQTNDETSDNKRIIPTITIGAGKANDNDNESTALNNGNGEVTAGDSGAAGEVKDAALENAAKSENGQATNRSAAVGDSADIATAATTPTTTTTTTTAATTEAIAENDQSDDRGKSTPTSNTDDSTQTTINRVSATIDSGSNSNSAVPCNQQRLQREQTASDDDADGDDDYDDDDLRSGTQNGIDGSWSSCGGGGGGSSSGGQYHGVVGVHTATPAKSCLSRHNSTHTSIKKKVNISTHAEIIEPDPLPPPPYDHASLGGDDDDVFSDSLPPQKRESMCAPYIERDELPDNTAAFAHGLPEWFNDERINDIGCIEPPVTPVGRDELELKRQRLYTDLLRAAHAAVEHNVRFTPLVGDFYATHPPHQHADDYDEDEDEDGRAAGDCDPDLKPSIAENLEHLVNRLEKLVERLERSISARELELANRTFDTVLAKKRESFDLETTELPPLPVESLSQQLSEQTDQLNERIERIESTLNKINDRHSSSLSASVSQNSQQQQKEGSLENIPTVLEDYQSPRSTEDEEEPLLLPPPPSMSVLGYQDIVNGPLSQYLSLSAKIGGDVAKHAAHVKAAFDAQLQYVTLATQCSQPGQDKQMELLKPTSAQISAIQDYREKNRASPYFNHLSAISESIPALGWVCVSPTPGPHVKEMNDAGQFYTNRVLKEWKEKDAKHVEWARAWIQTLTELQAYIKQYHTTGLVWSGKGGVPAGRAGAPPPPPMGPPPPPPPTFDLASMSLEGSADERSALFAEINQGEAITKNLKKVTADMQTHKNPTLRTGPAPFKTPTQFGSVSAGAGPAASVAKEPVFARDGKKWIIEYQRNNAGLLVENAEMNNVVYAFRCEGSTLTVKGKVNSIVIDSCKKCSLLFESVVASVEFVNCQSVQMQVLGFVPTISIDKTDGCQMYLSKGSLGVEIVSSKSSEMNVMLPAANGDYTELAVPEQYKTTISGKTLKTVCVDSLG